MSSDQLGVVMISMAHVHARGYAREIAAHPRAKVIGVWDERPDRGIAEAERLGVPFESDLQGVFARKDVEGVVCSAPSSDHFSIILGGLSAGKHVFTEKVLALKVHECRELLERAQESGVTLLTSMPLLGTPALRWAKAAIEDGRFGKVTMLRARTGGSVALDESFTNGWYSWFADPVQAGGGALVDVGCHAIYQLCHLAGQPVAVTAATSNCSGTYPVEDSAAVILEFADGCIGVAEASWAQHGGPSGVAIYGTRGWATFRQSEALVRCGGEGFTTDRHGILEPAPLPPPWPSPIHQWVSAALDGVTPQLRPEWGAQVTEVLQAAYVSSEEGRRVTLPIN